MLFDSIPSLNSSTKILNVLSERQKVISDNVANVHTPGYTAKHVSFDTLLERMDSPFETRMSHKMGSVQQLEAETGAPVDLQKELLEMQKNLLFYNMATRRISTVITELKTASQVGR